MERLKLVNVLKSAFLGSEFHMFTIRSKMLLLREMHRVFCTTYIYDLEQKVAYLAQKISHSLNEWAQIEFCNTMPSQ